MWDSIDRLYHAASTSQTQRKGTNRLHRRRAGFDGSDRDACSTRSTSRLNSRYGEVKKAAIRTREAFLEFEQCLQRCKARDTCRSRDECLLKYAQVEHNFELVYRTIHACERTDLLHRVAGDEQISLKQHVELLTEDGRMTPAIRN